MKNQFGVLFGALVSDALQACGVTLSNVAGTIAGRALEQLLVSMLLASSPSMKSAAAIAQPLSPLIATRSLRLSSNT